MKNIIVLIILFVLTIRESYGQLKFGIRSGINIATSKEVIAFAENRLGFYGGLYIDRGLSERLFMRLESLYTSKGFKNNNRSGDPYFVYRFNYLSIPVLIGYKIDTRTNILFGPELSYQLAVRKLIDDDNNLDYLERYPSRFDAGMSVGINYRAYKNLGVEVRYIYGFDTIYYVDASGNRNGDGKGANRIFQIGLLLNINEN